MAVWQLDHEPDFAVPAVCLLGSHHLTDHGVTSARQSDVTGQTILDVLQFVVHSKLGLAMRHMPSGYEAVNVMWMWAALLAMNISSWLQAFTEHDKANGRAHGKRLRRELVCIAARVTRHARRIEVHTSLEDHTGAFGDAWRALDVLLAGKSP